MRQWLTTLVLAIAVTTLPFGMGAMMQSHPTVFHGQSQMAANHAGKTSHEMPSGAKLHQHFMVCGACLSLPVPDGAIAARPEPGALHPWTIVTRLSGALLLPATPPPRA